MKQYFLLILLFSCAAFSSLNAQEKNDSIVSLEERKFIFFDDLTSQRHGEGQVNVYQDPRLIMTMTEHAKRSNINLVPDFILINGYRVQVYSSNTPRIAKDEAFSLEVEIKEKFPNVGVYITYASPFWRIRVGDCRSYHEATTLLNLLKKEFPQIKDTFYVIKEDVRISILDESNAL